MQFTWDKSFETLVVHFAHRFFDTDTPSEESVPRNRLIQFLSLVAVASPLLMILVILGEQSLQMQLGSLDAGWFRAGIHYTLICYAMAVMGLVITFRWDSLFPDRRDYLILASLPISANRLFTAKSVSVGFILLMFAIAANAVLIAFVAFMEPRALLGHIVGVLAGSVFSILFFMAVQGILMNVLPQRIFAKISPSVQMFAVALLITIVLILPLVGVSLRPLVEMNSSILDYFPPVWFLGLYESLNFKTSVIPNASVWAWSAVKMTGLLSLLVVLVYTAGYRRHARRVLESLDSADITGAWWWGRWSANILHGILNTNAYQRAAFDFIAKISGRSLKHRVSSALFSGLGLALAMSALFAIDRREAFPIRFSARGILEAPSVLSFLVVAGWRSTFGIPYELTANWIFQTTSRRGAADFRKAIRKWLFVCRILPLYALLAFFEFAWFDPPVALTHLVFDLVTTAFLIEAFFFGFRKVPFTCNYLQSKLQFALYAVAYLFAYTTYSTWMGSLKQWTTADPQHLVRFLAVSMIVFGNILIYRALTGAETSKFIYEEPDSLYQQLNLN